MLVLVLVLGLGLDQHLVAAAADHPPYLRHISTASPVGDDDVLLSPRMLIAHARLLLTLPPVQGLRRKG